MCGIVGIWKNGEVLAREALDRFTDSLAHRGPDGRGVELLDEGRLGLGHRRLAILDPSEDGRQPMRSEGGRYWISYNGEIFNFVELREELKGLGYAFRTGTDTEVVLAAYDRWGEEALLRFNGMWAMAIWDAAEKRLLLARDRFGIKPLFYCRMASGFAFASELKAFRHLAGFAPSLDPGITGAAMRDVFSVESREETIVRDVRRLPAGHVLRVSAEETTLKRWWRTSDHLDAAPRGYEAQMKRFGELFDDACALRMRSDVPMGTSLSGGLDSTAVLCATAGMRAGVERVRELSRAFVAAFPGSVNDEQATAQATADRLKLPCVTMRFDDRVDPEEVVRSVCDLEEVYLTAPLPACQVYEAQRREKIVVSLDGHGADELLGGYPHQTAAALENGAGFWRQPGRSWDLANTARFQTVSPDGSRASVWSMLAKHDPAIRSAQRGLLGLYRATLKPIWLALRGARRSPESEMSEDWLAPLERGAVKETSDGESMAGPLNRILYRDFHRTVLPTILRNLDRCSMAHGVESRMPFMDWRLVCFAFALPDASKVGAGYSKRILRDSMRGRIPDSVREDRVKVGFNSPLADWFNGTLKTWLNDELRSQAFLENDMWNGRAIAAFAEKRAKGPAWTWQDCERLWPIVSAHLLMRFYRSSKSL